MKQHPAYATKARSSHLPPWLVVVLLGMFLAARGLVPAGFMPAAVAGGSLYELCHGDSRSALLLNLTASSGPAPHPVHHQTDHETHHGGHSLEPAQSGHQHDSATAQVFSDNHCSFSATVVAAAHAGQWLPALEHTAAPVAPAVFKYFPRNPHYVRPPGRAPPTYFLT
ncbi:hypothetical protein [Microbulbifer aggregans]|uniref:hypothetical protein n=1 Tax=Microbulbifer aggregans TaxID=1769779 RepID=UPI001CFC8872|nr:hypothetical protein [Microbulbifer aggregans]